MTNKSSLASKPPGWRRWISNLSAWVEAVSLSYDELQDRRIGRLERDVAELKSRLSGGGEPR